MGSTNFNKIGLMVGNLRRHVKAKHDGTINWACLVCIRHAEAIDTEEKKLGFTYFTPMDTLQRWVDRPPYAERMKRQLWQQIERAMTSAGLEPTSENVVRFIDSLAEN